MYFLYRCHIKYRVLKGWILVGNKRLFFLAGYFVFVSTRLQIALGLGTAAAVVCVWCAACACVVFKLTDRSNNIIRGCQSGTTWSAGRKRS